MSEQRQSDKDGLAKIITDLLWMRRTEAGGAMAMANSDDTMLEDCIRRLKEIAAPLPECGTREMCGRIGPACDTPGCSYTTSGRCKLEQLAVSTSGSSPHPDEVISKIIKDIKDRSGLGNAWDDIDVDIRNEIVAEWRTYFVSASGLNNPTSTTAEHK